MIQVEPVPLPQMCVPLCCRARDLRFPMLMMAPEGTCGDGRCVLEFKRGGFVPGVPVLPVLLRYDLTAHSPAWGITNLPAGFVRLVLAAAPARHMRGAMLSAYCQPVQLAPARPVLFPACEARDRKAMALPCWSMCSLNHQQEAKTKAAHGNLLGE